MPVVLFFTIILFIAIKIEDKGKTFYVSDRVGKNGKIFKMYKFRSMKANSEDIRLEDGSTYSGDDDFRITKVGKFIRKTSIDELPQIVNVFIGNMSFIGPRPDPVDWLERYPKEYLDFLKVKPGITGYNQAYFRNSTDGIEKMKNDLFYAKKISFLFDVKIFFKTIFTILLRKNLNKK